MTTLWLHYYPYSPTRVLLAIMADNKGKYRTEIQQVRDFEKFPCVRTLRPLLIATEYGQHEFGVGRESNIMRQNLSKCGQKALCGGEPAEGLPVHV